MALVTNYKSSESLESMGLTEDKPTLLYVGPYATNYSLARVNRGLAIALAKQHNYNVKIWKNPGKWIDREATEADITANPALEGLLTATPGEPEVTIFNSTPINDTDGYKLAELPGKLKIMYIALEENVIPEQKVTEINENMHAVMAASQFTADILRNNGIQIPIKVVKNAIDDRFFDYTPGIYPIKTKKKFKFLHISSARQRKGVDILLNSYFAAFNGDDDVTLIIKSFPGPDNLVNDLLGKLNTEADNPPEVIHIMDPDLTEEELIDLNNTADVCVYPTRAEGFGLPIAEAMYLERIVITTNYSGQLEFCNHNNSVLLDYKIVDALDSEMVNIGAKWAEPNGDQLAGLMKDVYENHMQPRYKGIGLAAKKATAKLTWENSAKETWDFIAELEPAVDLKQMNLGVITPYNSTGGISEYSKYLYSPIAKSFKNIFYFANRDIADRVRGDEAQITRCWEIGDNKFNKCIAEIKKHNLDFLHIQHHTAEISPAGLKNLIAGLKSELPKLKVFITLHDSIGSLNEKLTAEILTLDKIFIHNKEDYEKLSNKGRYQNIIHFAHPYHYFPRWDKKQLRDKLGIDQEALVIATHGIIAEHKGLLQTAEAIAQVKKHHPNLLWIAANAINVNNVSSGSTADRLIAKIKELGIESETRLFTKFFESDLQIAVLLGAADVGVLPYDEVGEGASGAVRKLMAAGLPTIINRTKTLDDLDDAVIPIKNNQPKSVATAIQELAEKSPLEKNKLSSIAREISADHNWFGASVKMLSHYRL